MKQRPKNLPNLPFNKALVIAALDIYSTWFSKHDLLSLKTKQGSWKQSALKWKAIAVVQHDRKLLTGWAFH